jgi:uncharacterized membrane protein YdjX (TVP38/TMEM64 family)
LRATGLALSPKVLPIVAVAVMLLLAYRLGVLHQFADPRSVQQSLVRLGAWGYLVFVVAYAVLQPFIVPGTVFIVAAPLIWPWPVAFALSMAGTMAASVVGFSFARLVARDWIAARIPVQFRRYDDALAARAFVTVFLLRFVFWMPPPLHFFFGVSKVRFWTHFWGSFFGYLTPLFLVSFFGQKLFDLARLVPAKVWVEAGVAVVAALAAAWGGRHWLRSRRTSRGRT